MARKSEKPKEKAAVPLLPGYSQEKPPEFACELKNITKLLAAAVAELAKIRKVLALSTDNPEAKQYRK